MNIEAAVPFAETVAILSTITQVENGRDLEVIFKTHATN
jgi:hypothetical protein